MTDDVKKDKEKEPEKGDRPESATVPKKKGFEDGPKGSEDDSSEDEQVTGTPGVTPQGGSGRGEDDTPWGGTGGSSVGDRDELWGMVVEVALGWGGWGHGVIAGRWGGLG